MDVSSQEKTDPVGEAKQRLRLAAAQFEPLGFVKRNPLRAAGAAFLAGLIWNSPRRRPRATPALLPLAMQMAGFAARWSLAARQR